MTQPNSDNAPMGTIVYCLRYNHMNAPRGAKARVSRHFSGSNDRPMVDVEWIERDQYKVYSRTYNTIAPHGQQNGGYYCDTFSIEDPLERCIVCGKKDPSMDYHGHKMCACCMQQCPVWIVELGIHESDNEECTILDRLYNKENWYEYPYVMERRKEVGFYIPRETKPINNDRYPHLCPYCGAPAYIGGMNNIDCSRKCRTVNSAR